MGFVRFIVALFMAIIVPISNCFSVHFGEVESVTYTDFEKTKKASRDYGNFEAEKNDIFVEVSKENGDGTESSPFNNIFSAKEKAKALRADGVSDKITVWISEGTYIFENTLVFDETDADNVVFRAMPNEKVNFTGAVSISDFTDDIQNGVKVLCADIPEGMKFDSVTKSGNTMPKTRYPKTGYLKVEKEDHSDALFTAENTPWEFTLADKAFIGNSQYNPTEIKNVQNVVVRIMHYWVNDLHYLTGYNSEQNKYYLANPTGMTIKTGDRYFFENIYEELNSPGEWYFDIEESKLYYVPCEGENAENTVLNVCVNDKLISMSDTKNIEFFGITFCDTNFSYPEEFEDSGWLNTYGIRFPQAELDVEGAIEITKAQNINFTNCNFFNIGNTALKFSKAVKDSHVKGCHFKNIGANGVFIHGYNAVENEKITENITIYDNKIESYGRNWQSAIGVLQTHARNCTIEHNEISDGYYTAISVGWVWGYSYSVTQANTIKDNLIYNIGQGWLSDMGGIYTLGIQNGTVISGNVIHDVAADPNEGGYGGWGLYFDEGSSNIIAENNLVYNCGSDSFHQHYGKDNLLRNNIFALSANSQIKTTRKEDHNQFHLNGNIILTDNSLAYSNAGQGHFTDDGNLYWDLARGKYAVSSVSDSADNYEDLLYNSTANLIGYHKNAVYENPQFRDPENGDFLIADGNKAIEKIGFTPWDYTKAGTMTSFQ